MPSVHQQIPNPFPMLLEEERTRQVQAREALFLTFNVDLAFFEAQVLGTCLAMGARVSIIADGNVWAPDPRAVRHAGRSYNVGLVTGSMAFHPKVVILAGEERVQVAIGSGNLTLGGWQYNDEVWVQFTGDKTSYPTIFNDIAEWLRGFAYFLWLDADSSDSVRRTYALIQRLLEQSEPVDTGHTFITSAEEAILGRLPSEPVTELRLHAPFLDSSMAATSRLIERLRPQKASLLLQPGLTVFDPVQVQECADKYGIHIEAQESDRKNKYRHGKVIWWKSNGTSRVLVGSPNLSGAALLRAWSSGGNYETAVVGPASVLTVPDGRPVDASSISPANTGTAYPSLRPGSSIRSARIVDGALTITLSSPASMLLELEASEFRDPPEQWSLLGSFQEGQIELRTACAMSAVSRVRLSWRDAEIKHVGQIMFVMDPLRISAAPRTPSRAKSYKSPTPGELWQDAGRALDSLDKDFAALREVSLRTIGPRAAAVGEGAQPRQRPVPSVAKLNVESPWLWDLEAASRIQGPLLTAFVLGLPPAPASSKEVVAPPRWADVLVDDNEAVLDDEHDDAVASVIPKVSDTEALAPDHSKSPEADRRRRRKRCAQWVASLDDQPPFVQLAMLRIVTSFFSAGNWDSSDVEPLRLMSTLIRHLANEPIPDELRASVSSMTLVSCAVMRGATDLRTTSEATIIYRGILESAVTQLGRFDEDLASEYCRTLVGHDSQTLRLDHVQHLIESDLTGDEFKDARAAAAQAGWEFLSQGGTKVFVHGKFSNPELAAITVAGWIDRDNPPPVWAINSNGGWCMCIWERPNLIIADGKGPRPIWKHFRLASHMSPAAFANQRRSDDSYSSGKQRISQPWLPFPEAKQALVRWGLAGPAPLMESPQASPRLP